MDTKGTKRACGLCLTKCGLGLKRIGVMLGVSHPLVKRWRGEAGITGQVGPKMGGGVLKGRSSRRHPSVELKYRVHCNVSRTCRMARTHRPDSIQPMTGCTRAELISHIEAQFSGSMAWDNYGAHWEVDHIKPCFSFDLSDPNQQRECFHFTNLRPLEKEKNQRRPKRVHTLEMELGSDGITPVRHEDSLLIAH